MCKNGNSWRDLPDCFPPWQTVYWYFRKWNNEGVYDLIVNELRVFQREKVGKHQTPSAAIIDSQSVKNTSFSTQEVGVDGGKRVKDRKRHIVTDTLGNLLAVKVHAANVHDSKSAQLVLAKMVENSADFPRLKKIFADKGYRGNLLHWVKKHLKCELEIVKTYSKLANNGKMLVSPKRWVVERSFAWLNHYRRLSKDFERLTDNSECFIKIAFIRLFIKKLKN
ncbi:IS5 family transposase [Emticicia sp. BO119]|nr:IS5 family transposase [Emticicia sp. BO119]